MSLWSQQSRTLYMTLGLTIFACLGVWLPTPFVMCLTAAALLAFFLPGWWLLRAIRLTAEDWLEQVVFAVGTSYGLTILLALGILYATGRLPTSWVAGVLTLTASVLTVVSLLRPPISPASHRLTFVDILCFFIPVASAGFFSFVNLGYSDYWGDEMNGLLRAVSVIGGRLDTLFEHTKGPVEVLLPAVFGLLVGRFEPFTLRLPFALAHVVGSGGFYLLGRRLFSRNVGLLAALILVVNGLYLAFGRIVQYQAVVFLMTGLSILTAYYFYKGGGGIYLTLSSLFVGVGLLAHYDMLLVLPPIAYLVWRRYVRQGADWREDWHWLIGAVGILLMVVAFFYIPFILHPHLTKTSSYLSRIVGASNWPASNFDELYVFAVMYNSSYYVAFIVLLGVGKMAVDLIRVFYGRHWNKELWLVIIATLVLCLLAIIVAAPTSDASFVPLLICISLLVLLVGFSPLSVELKMIYVWVGVSFIGYVFFVDHPRTHLQIIYPGWSLLVALAARDLVSTLQARFEVLRHRGAIVTVVIILFLLFGLFAGYEYLLFVDAGREYIFTYPSHKSPLYWEDANFPFGSRRLYGAPHRLGWQMINSLFLQGYLQGDWDSNDDGSNLFWYTLGSPRNACYPQYYFVAHFQQKEGMENNSTSFSPADYVKIGQIWNRDRLQIEVYEFMPMGPDTEQVIWSEPVHYASSYVVPNKFYSSPYEETSPEILNPLPSPLIFRPGPSVLQQIADQYGDPRIVNVRDTVALVGYDLDDTWARPGGFVVLTLYWQAAEMVNLPYKIFVHLESDSLQGDAANLWAAADDFPACGTQSTQSWQVGQTVVDRHMLRLPDDVPSGDYSLRVGLYEPQTGLRMDLLDELGNPQGTSLELTTLTVEPTKD
jgi:4-amino-4-deoxy-L-arabinose transferase-like glycosyltransferase